MGKHRDWTEIRNDYQLNGLSYAKLAEKYGISIGTLKKAAAREGWTNRKQKAERLTDTKINRAERMIGRAEKKVPDENGTKETVPFEETPENRFQRTVSKLLEKAEIAVDNLPPDAAKAIKELSGALKDLAALKGWNKDELDRQEQQARIEKLRAETRNASREDEKQHFDVSIMGMSVEELAEILR